MARSRSKQKKSAASARRRGQHTPVRAKRKPATKKPPRDAAKTTTEGDSVLAIYAHDIRTSLTGILALGELLASSNIGDRERHWAAGIKASAEHLAALTTLAIDAAKAQAGALALQQEGFRPRRLIEALGASLAARAETKGLHTEVKVTDDLPDMLIGDAVRLRAALENLIDNAVKFTAKGTVRLEASASAAARGRMKLAFTVADSGIGLKRGEIARLFRPFAQANTEIARRYGGAGLGLSVVKVLAKKMGGDLTVESTPGQGSRFRFTAMLPLGRGEAAHGGEVRARVAAPRRLKILCVEDNPYGRVILNTILTEIGHQADFAGSGEEGVGAAARGYDAILMDITLPRIDGLEATRRIRALGGGAGATPIIGITGRTEAGDEAAARAAGMSFYLRKPVSPSSLNAAIAAVAK
jgi:CheY-like chemotaxis protein/nitrogen-specific signal transduction histidine kinase